MIRRLAISLFAMLCILKMLAQDVMVTVVPIQQVLPPQALMYIDNPGKYFNISITNTTSEIQNVYLTINIDCNYPERMSVLATPADIQPKMPITIAPLRTLHITMADLKHQFGHLSSKNIKVSSRLMSGYSGGSFGLLPEGMYQMTVAAYKWHNPKYASPVMVSNPVSSTATFSVSYLAKAPQLIAPVINSATQSHHAEVDPLNAMFSWTESIILSNPVNVRYTYSLKVVEVLPGQPIDHAMDNNPAVYHICNLISPVCVIPSDYVLKRMSPTKLYAAQVTAESRTMGTLDYVLVENRGKSDIRPFRIVPTHLRSVEPSDTLQDKELLAFTDGIYEEDDDDTLSIDDHIQKIMDCTETALMMEVRTKECDSISRLCLRDIRNNIAQIRNMSHAAAKKAGITDSTKNGQANIKRYLRDAEEASDIAAIQYKAAYLTLQRLERLPSKDREPLNGTSYDILHTECVEAVSKAKTAARNAQVHYSSIQKTEYLADKLMKKIY